MTKEEFKSQILYAIAYCNGDIEDQHSMVDQILCKALTDLGYEEGVKIFEGMEKWYA